MITRTGARLLDFGLARAVPLPARRSRRRSAGPRVTGTLTTEGTILGTLSYMAPEQIDGRDVDTRADVFAFGAVLFEMVTGLKAFEGETPARVMSAILRDEPARVSSIVPVTPAALEALIHACLAKDPNDRWQNIADVARQLRHLREMMSGRPLRRRIPAPIDSAAGGDCTSAGSRGAPAPRAWLAWIAAAVCRAHRGGPARRSLRAPTTAAARAAGAPRAHPAAGRHVSHRHARALARWRAAGVCRRRSDRPPALVDAAARSGRGAAARRHRGCERSVLVAGRRARRVLRRRHAETRRRRRRHRRRDLRRQATAPAARGIATT